MDSGETDPLDVDTDDDGLWDGYTLTFNNETFAGELSYETGPCEKDEDGDLLYDGLEIGLVDGEILTDSEMHSILGNDIDATDTSAGNYTQDQDEANTTDPTDSDTDNDGLLDGHDGSQVGEDIDCDGIIDVDGSQFYTETDPNDADTDGDGIDDGVERGVPGYDEDTDNMTNPLDRDTDDDGLTDGEEDLNKNGKVDAAETDPYDPDTDGDGLTDGLESNVASPIGDSSSGVYRGTDTTAEFAHYNKTVKNYTGATQNETDPLDIDTDDDGQPDGWIDGWMWDWHLKCWMQNGSEEDQAVQIWEGEDLDLDGVIETDNYEQTSGAYPNETYPVVGDSDGDLIPDAIEAYFGLDPLNESDAWEDMDEDYLSNREEYLQGVESDDPYIDNDDDHLINFNDANDDVDVWYTAWEVEWGMDPYADDSDLDLDDDGLDNTYEWTWQQYVNLTSADSDGDGLEDGWELDYWNVTRGFGDEEKSLNYTATYDVDGDGISDGQEYEGYNVTIASA